jgi:uncharacterized protein (DUF1501 family)
MTLTRRTFVAASFAPALAFAGNGREGGSRFVFVILRGGMDGLAAVPAVGDPDFAPARGALAQYASTPLPLSAPFALHPNLVQLHAMYGRGELAVVHAVGLPYRERSHFDGQQVLESGGTQPYQLSTGWLGRALAANGGKGLALNTAVPLVLRGKDGVDTWAPSALPEPGADLVARLQALYADDRTLAQALARAKGLRDDAMPTTMAADGGGGRAAQAAALARKAGEFLAQPNGPQAAVLELGGWDTHANQAAPNGALATNLRFLDGALAALRETLLNSSNTWSRTVIVVASEFGREVAVNGTMGSDHGSGGAAFVLGGAVQGGRVIADWPGLAKQHRFEGRDLRTTTDLRAVLKTVVGEHLRVSAAALEREVFPDSATARPLATLLRT